MDCLFAKFSNLDVKLLIELYQVYDVIWDVACKSKRSMNISSSRHKHPCEVALLAVTTIL